MNEPIEKSPVQDFAQTVKQQADIVKVIEGYIRLRKAGAQNYSGLCPFHKEKIAVVLRACGAAVLSLLRLRCFGRRFQLRRQDRERRLSRSRARSSRRSAAFRCPSASSLRPSKRPKRACAPSCSICTRPPRRGLRSSCAGRRVRWRANTLPAAGFRRGHQEIPHRLCARQLQRAARPTERHGGPGDAPRKRTLQLEGAGRRQSQGPIYDRFRKRVDVSHLQRERARDRVHGANAGDGREGRARSTSTRRRRRSIPRGRCSSILTRPNRRFVRDEVCTAGRGADGLHQGLSRRFERVWHSECDRHQRHCLYRAAGGAAEAPVLRRESGASLCRFRSRHRRTERRRKVYRSARRTAKASSHKSSRSVTLDGGLDPDRFIRERGVEAFKEAIRGARLYTDFLIERARQIFPGASADQKVKAMNYLLPHIRKMPEMVERPSLRLMRRRSWGSTQRCCAKSCGRQRSSGATT